MCVYQKYFNIVIEMRRRNKVVERVIFTRNTFTWNLEPISIESIPSIQFYFVYFVQNAEQTIKQKVVMKMMFSLWWYNTIVNYILKYSPKSWLKIYDQKKTMCSSMKSLQRDSKIIFLFVSVVCVDTFAFHASFWWY